MTNSQKTPMLTEQQQTRLLSTIRKEKLVEWGKQPELYNVQDEEDLARICIMLFEMPIDSRYRIRLLADPKVGEIADLWRTSAGVWIEDNGRSKDSMASSKDLFNDLLCWWYRVQAFGTVQVYKSGDAR
jgi:hypothetical protein